MCDIGEYVLLIMKAGLKGVFKGLCPHNIVVAASHCQRLFDVYKFSRSGRAVRSSVADFGDRNVVHISTHHVIRRRQFANAIRGKRDLFRRKDVSQGFQKPLNWTIDLVRIPGH